MYVHPTYFDLATPLALLMQITCVTEKQKKLQQQMLHYVTASRGKDRYEL